MRENRLALLAGDGRPGEQNPAGSRHLVHRPEDFRAEAMAQDHAGHATGEAEPGGKAEGDYRNTCQPRPIIQFL